MSKSTEEAPVVSIGSLTSYRLGVLVPSSNTTIEPVINHLLGCIDRDQRIRITAHFSRFRVTQISLEESATSQFDIDKMLQAASLLADAGVDAIAWGGTSAGWLGIDQDRRLCAAIEERFGIPATTSTLALIELVHLLPGRELGLVTPYIQGMNDAIRKNFASEDIEVVDDRGLSITDNKSIANVTLERLEEMLIGVLSANPDLTAVVVFCTNLSSAYKVCDWERRFSQRGVVVLDSVSTTIWGLLKKIGLDVPSLRMEGDAGSIFTLPKGPLDCED